MGARMCFVEYEEEKGPSNVGCRRRKLEIVSGKFGEGIWEGEIGLAKFEGGKLELQKWKSEKGGEKFEGLNGIAKLEPRKWKRAVWRKFDGGRKWNL